MENFKYVNRYGYSDVEPFEVVERKSEKRVVVRSMKSVRSADWKPEMVPGGFSAHCTNNRQQKWDITSDEENGVLVTITKRKDGKWYEVGDNYVEFGFGTFERDPDTGERVAVDKPRKFYDYNF